MSACSCGDGTATSEKRLRRDNNSASEPEQGPSLPLSRSRERSLFISLTAAWPPLISRVPGAFRTQTPASPAPTIPSGGPESSSIKTSRRRGQGSRWGWRSAHLLGESLGCLREQPTAFCTVHRAPPAYSMDSRCSTRVPTAAVAKAANGTDREREII